LDTVPSARLPKLRAIVYDLEIQEPPESVGGWENVRRGEAGVSCVVLYDSSTKRFHTYDEFGLEDCIAHMNQADVLVSFNGLEFDTPILQSITGLDIYPRQYDILHEVWKALPTRTKGYKLSDICGRLGLGEKNFTGETAVKLYQSGRFGRLFDYCISDVHLTRTLARFITEHGYVLTPEGDHLELPKVMD
jgi:hypothetical protein